jgi:hypothetical protein
MEHSKRRRVSKACDECNKRKVKCDGKFPCSTCVKSGKECTYINPNKRLKKESELTPGSRESSAFAAEIMNPYCFPMPIIKEWNHKDIAELKLVNKQGTAVYWTDIYFDQVYKQSGLFPKKIFDAHFYDLPLPLLHAMITCCEPFSVESKKLFSYHFDVCMNTKAPFLDPISLFGVFIELHLTIYYMFSSRTTSAIYSGTLCIRMGQILGIHEYRDLPKLLVSSGNYLPSSVCRELGSRSWLYLYFSDFYVRPLFHIPSCIHQDVSNELLQYFSLEAVNIDSEE